MRIFVILAIFSSFTESLQIFNSLPSLSGLTVTKPSRECLMKTPERIKLYGYPVETHKIITEDKYILTNYRIPSGKNGETGKEPVILLHGILSSSNDWLVVSNNSLPFLLADLGYDVWLYNCRGSSYSLEHQTLYANQKAFWDFSHHEMGIYDLPALINYVLENTNRAQKQVSLIGHSMGGALVFIALNNDPQLHSKIRKLVALSPAVYLSNMRTPIVSILGWIPSRLLQGALDTFSRGRFLPGFLISFIHLFLPYFCSTSFTARICESVLFLVVGYNPTQYSPETLCKVVSQVPSDTSAKTLVHYMQEVYPAWQNKVSNLGCGDPKNTYIQPEFQQYDYGCEGNYRRYNSSTPPKYNLASVQADTMVMWTENDWLVHQEDVKRTVRELGNVNRQFTRAVKDKLYNHLDYFYHPTAKEQVYDHCINFLTT